MEGFLPRKSLLLFFLIVTLPAFANRDARAALTNAVGIEQASSQADPVNAGPILFDVTFNEAVTGFAGSDVDLSSSTVGGTLTANVTEIAPNNGTKYRVSVSGMTSSGNVIAEIPAGAATLVSDGTTTTAAATHSDNTVAYDIDGPAMTGTTPVDGATAVALGADLDIDFDGAVVKGTGTIDLRRVSDDAVIESFNVASSPRVTLMSGNTKARINPTGGSLASNTEYYVIVPVGAFKDAVGNDFPGINTNDWDFETVNLPPTLTTLVPADGSNDRPINLASVQITFSEQVVNVGDNSDSDNRIIIKNLDTNSTHETINPQAAGRVTLTSGGTVATITLTVPLLPSTNYAVRIGNSVFEDVDGAAFAGTDSDTQWNFETEHPPANIVISSGTNSSNSNSCIGESVDVVGTDFGTAPRVFINGVEAVVSSPSDTHLLFIVPAGVVGSYAVSVMNTSNNLSGTSSAINIKPAIQLNLGVTANPANAPVGGSSSIEVANSQTTVSYRLSQTVPSTINIGNSQNGTGAMIAFGTSDAPNGFNYPAPGTSTYQYTITASSSGCTTAALTLKPTVTVTAVTADAGGDKNICGGSSVVIGGAPTASGGTGFLNISWSGPGGFSSSVPNPTVTLPGTYTVTVKDDSNVTDTDDVTLTAQTQPGIVFVDTLRTQFTYDQGKYQLSNKVVITPNDGSGIFSGVGVSLNADNKYYFNPQAFTAPTYGVVITYTHTGANGCTNTRNFSVNVNQPGTLINNLKPFYCLNDAANGVLTFNSGAFTMPAGKSFSSFKIYNGYDYLTGQYLFYDPADPNYPLYNSGGLKFSPTRANALMGTNYIYILIYLKTTATNVEDTYFYTYATTRVVLPGPVPEILPLAEGGFVCEKASPVALSNTPPPIGYTIQNFFESDDNSVTGSGPYLFNPDLVDFGALNTKNITIRLNYKDYNDCAAVSARTVQVVKKINGPDSDDQKYCQFYDGKRVLTATSPLGLKDFTWYENPALTDPTPGIGPVFDTEISTQSAITKTYYVTQTLNTCESFPSTVELQIIPAPQINLAIPGQCVNKPYDFIGPVIAGADDAVYKWKFNDQGVEFDTKDVNYTHTRAGLFSVSLTVRATTGVQECETSAEFPVTVGDNPIPTFTFNQLCDGDNTKFNSAANMTVEKLEWDFGDGDQLPNALLNASANAHSGRTGGTYKDPTHRFVGGAASYPVILRATTNLNCSGTVKKTVTILPYLTGFDADSPYIMEDLNGGDGFWTVDSTSVNSSWNFVAPNDTVIYNAANAWVTNGNKYVNFGSYKSNDQSAVNSPCFDISGFARPVISLHYISNTDLNDGAVLQYTTDGVNWVALGKRNTGLNWYNAEALSGGTPGGQNQVAWSGNLFESNVQNTDTLWLEGKHSLDPWVPAAKRNKVRFRLAFASNGDLKRKDGFAFNNVHIEERNRTMLIENFTNENAEAYSANNTSFIAYAADDAVKLQYHLSFPGADALNAQNPVDPNARGAFYGINNNSQIVPRAYVDGTSRGSFTTDWYKVTHDLRSLVTSPLVLNIGTAPANPGELTVTTTVMPTKNILKGKLVAHVVVAENPVGGNEFVVRKMLPNASGTKLTLPLMSGVPLTLPNQTWKINIAEVTPANLVVAVFVQDEETGEVLQAAMLDNPGNLPTEIVTGVESSFSMQTSVYPNPADRELNVYLPEASRKEFGAALVDSYGRELQLQSVPAGRQRFALDTRHVAAGMYLLQFEPKPGVLVRKKVLVVHP